MSDNLLIKIKEIGDYRIKIYYDAHAECPATSWDLCGRYLFEYSNRYHHTLHSECNWNDWFFDKGNHSLEDALHCMAREMLSQQDIINYYKKGNFDGARLVYNRSTHLWELQQKFYLDIDGACWDTQLEIAPSDLETCDYRYELTECLEYDDLVRLLQGCAKDVVIKKWSSTGYCQGDYLDGIAYVTKERYDKLCGRTDVDWKQYAIELIDAEVKDIGMWAWGDVKRYVLEKKVPYIKQYNDPNRKNEEAFDWEEVHSCCGYFMEADKLIEEVMAEYGLKDVT